MTGHSSWKGVRPIQDPTGHILRSQLDYCDGYMLAFDDLFKDINEIEQQKMWGEEARELIRRIRRQMHNLRGGAKDTQKLLMRENIHQLQAPREEV